MKMFCSVLFLVAGLALSGAAPATPEECERVLKVLSLSDRTKVYGKKTLIMAFNSNEVEKTVLRNTKSGVINIVDEEHGGFLLTQELKVNDTCVHISINATVEGDVATGEVLKVLTNQYQLYETCEGSLVVSVNSSHTHPENFLKKLAVSNDKAGHDALKTRSLYLFSTETMLDDAKLDHFKTQAACLGFQGEHTFHYDGKTEVCAPPETS